MSIKVVMCVFLLNFFKRKLFKRDYQEIETSKYLCIKINNGFASSGERMLLKIQIIGFK